MSELQVVIDAAEAADSKGEHDEEKLVQHPFSLIGSPPVPRIFNIKPCPSDSLGLLFSKVGAGTTSTGGLPIKVGGKDKEGTLEEMMDQFAKRMSELQVVARITILKSWRRHHFCVENLPC
jgi:hypothetical protein